MTIAAEALRLAFGKDPVYHRSGGSIPVVAAMDTALDLKTVMIGLRFPNGNFPRPNEWMRR